MLLIHSHRRDRILLLDRIRIRRFLHSTRNLQRRHLFPLRVLILLARLVASLLVALAGLEAQVVRADPEDRAALVDRVAIRREFCSRMEFRRFALARVFRRSSPKRLI